MVLVGNKIDRNDERFDLHSSSLSSISFFRIISKEEGRNLADLWKIPFVEVTAMDIKVIPHCSSNEIHFSL